MECSFTKSTRTPNFQRLANGFSNKLTSEKVLDKYESQEKQIYENKKKEIQNYVLRYFADMTWKFDTQNLSHYILSKIQDRVTRLGFSYKYKEGEYCPGGMGEGGGFTKSEMIISLPADPIEEDDGYFSEGWKSEFKASEVRNKIQMSLNKEYLELTAKIEAVILGCPGYQEYTLKPNSISPIVMEWVKADLDERGLTMQQVHDSCPSDSSGSYTEYSSYWKIVNPKINNYRSKEIYL